MSPLNLILGKGGEIVTTLTPAECHARLSAVIGPDFDLMEGAEIRGHITPEGGVLRQRSTRRNVFRAEFSFSVRATDTGSRIVWRTGMSWFAWTFSAFWVFGILATGGRSAWNGLWLGDYLPAIICAVMLAGFGFMILISRIMAKAAGEEMARFVTGAVDGRIVV